MPLRLPLLLIGCLASACTGASTDTAIPREEVRADPATWRFERVGGDLGGLAPRLFAQPDGSMWIVASDTLSYDTDVECDRGILSGTLFGTWTGRSGAWEAGFQIDHPLGPGGDTPAVGVDPDGALWAASPEGQASFDYCGPTELLVQTTAEQDRTWATGEVFAEGGEVLPQTHIPGGWPALGFDTAGRPLLVHSRVTLGEDYGDERYQLELLRGPNQAEILADHEGRWPVLLTDRDALEVVAVYGDTLLSLVETESGWTSRPIGPATVGQAPDVAVLADGTRVAAVIDATGQATELRDEGSGWTERPLALPATAERIAVHADGETIVFAFSDGRDLHLIIEEGGERTEELVEAPEGVPCDSVDVALIDGDVHLAMSCPGELPLEAPIFHGWRRL